MPENTQRTTTKAGWHYANRPLVPLPTQSYIQRLPSAADRLSGGETTVSKLSSGESAVIINSAKIIIPFFDNLSASRFNNIHNVP